MPEANSLTGARRVVCISRAGFQASDNSKATFRIFGSVTRSALVELSWNGAVGRAELACVHADADLVVEALVGHVAVDLVAGVALPEGETLEVALQGLLDDVVQRLLLDRTLRRQRLPPNWPASHSPQSPAAHTHKYQSIRNW